MTETNIIMTEISDIYSFLKNMININKNDNDFLKNNFDEFFRLIYFQDFNNNTIFHQCIILEDLDMINFLLNFNINVNIQNNLGNTPIHELFLKIKTCIINKNFRKEFLYIKILNNILIKKNILSIKNNNNYTPFELIIDEINVKDKFGKNNMIFRLLWYENLSIVYRFIKELHPYINYFELNEKNNNLLHVLCYRLRDCKNDKIELHYLMYFFLKVGISEDQKNNYGCTPWEIFNKNQLLLNNNDRIKKKNVTDFFTKMY